MSCFSYPRADLVLAPLDVHEIKIVTMVSVNHSRQTYDLELELKPPTQANTLGNTDGRGSLH